MEERSRGGDADGNKALGARNSRVDLRSTLAGSLKGDKRSRLSLNRVSVSGIRECGVGRTEERGKAWIGEVFDGSRNGCDHSADRQA